MLSKILESVKSFQNMALAKWAAQQYEGEGFFALNNKCDDIKAQLLDTLERHGLNYTFQTYPELIPVVETLLKFQEHLGRPIGKVSPKQFDQLSEEEKVKELQSASMLYATQVLAWFIHKPPKRFRILPGLESRLSNTEIRGLKGKDISLPFSEVQLEFKDKLFMLIDPTDRCFCPLDHPNHCNRPMFMSRFIDGHYKYFSRDLILNHEEPIRSQIDLQEDQLINLLLNTLVYITNCHTRESLKEEATNPEFNALTDRIAKLPPGPKKERLKARRRALDPEYKIVIGKGVQSLSEEREALDARKLEVRTLVSGHWRNQVSGPRLSVFGEPIPAEERPHTKIFISPFWRGPEWGAPKGEAVRVAR